PPRCAAKLGGSAMALVARRDAALCPSPGRSVAQRWPRPRRGLWTGTDVTATSAVSPQRRLVHERGSDERIHLECVPAEQMTDAEVFDGVLITRVFHEIPVDSRAGLFRACYRALKRPGVFLKSDCVYPDALAA